MYLHAIDETHAVLLGVYAGTKQPGDLDACMASMLRTDAIAHAQGRGALFVVMPEKDYPSPNSRDRNTFASIKARCRATPNLFVLVTSSPLLRGVLTAVSWLSPDDACWRTVAADSFADAVVRAESFRATCGAPLRLMERELTASLRLRQTG